MPARRRAGSWTLCGLRLSSARSPGGEGFTERIAHIATKPVLRMRAKDGSSREWVLRDTDSPTTIINAFVECTRHRGVIVLPEGGTLEPDDDEM